MRWLRRESHCKLQELLSVYYVQAVHCSNLDCNSKSPIYLSTIQWRSHYAFETNEKLSKIRTRRTKTLRPHSNVPCLVGLNFLNNHFASFINLNRWSLHLHKICTSCCHDLLFSMAILHDVKFLLKKQTNTINTRLNLYSD